MTTVGYARVSSTGQDLAVQLEKLGSAGCQKLSGEAERRGRRQAGARGLPRLSARG